MKKSIFCLFFLLLAAIAGAAPLRNVPQTLVQPNGDTLYCFASGDEFFNYLHDARGYTIIQNPETGYYTYAVQDGEAVKASKYIVGQINPEKAALQKNTLPSARRMTEIIHTRRHLMPPDSQPSLSNTMNAPPSYAKNQGTLNNIVVFIRFSDESSATTFQPLNFYDALCNSGPNSMSAYFREVSYGLLDIPSTYYPVPNGQTVLSYQDPHPRSYYRIYSASNPNGYITDYVEREQTLLANAIKAIASQVPATLNIDMNNDGKVDNVSFIISGEPEGWAELLWPHRWMLGIPSYINGKMVYDYTFCLDKSLAVNVLCHETFHALGAPDLYHYSQEGLFTVGEWDIMEYSYLETPQHMGAYMKYKYGNWIGDIPTITSPASYTLSPLNTSSVNNCCKIPIQGHPEQFYVLEYRRQAMSGFESRIPGSGLLIYRIDTRFTGNAQYDGYNILNEVYLFRPNGSIITNGATAQAHFSKDVWRTTFNNSTNPYPFLSDGTRDGFNINISNVSEAGETISFDFTNVNVPVESIEITMPSPIQVGKQVPFSANIYPANASNKQINWRVVPGSAKYRISGNYLIGEEPGTITLEASATENHNISTTKEIEVQMIPIQGIAISVPDNVPITKKQIALTATITPYDATFKQLMWNVTNLSGSAEINSTNLVFKKTGYVLLKAAASDGSGITDEKTIFISDGNDANPVKTYWAGNNGADGLFNIENPEGIGKIEIYSSAGNLMEDIKGSASQTSTTVSFAAYPKGIYILRIWNGSKTKVSSVKIIW